MNEHELSETLRKADPSIRDLAAPVKYGSHIRRLAARRRRRTVVGTTGGVVVLLAMATLNFWPEAKPVETTVDARPSLVNPSPVEEMSLAEIRKAADAAQALANAIRERRSLAEQRAKAEQTLKQPDAAFLARLTLEQAAATRLLEAEQAARNGDMESARRSYERVLAAFPATDTSAVAEMRLTEIRQN